MVTEVTVQLAIILLLGIIAIAGLISLHPAAAWAQGAWVAVPSAAIGSVALALAVMSEPPSAELRALLGVVTVAAATFTGWPVTATILHRALDIPLREQHVDLPATGWVGLIERFGFSLALVLGLPEVAALIVGVKALGTYTPVATAGNTTSAARVLGTLTSVAWALCVSAIYLVSVR
jgi:hypothetical protein